MNLNLPTKYMYADTIETIITRCPHIKEVPYFSGIVQYTCAFNIASYRTTGRALPKLEIKVL